MFSLKQFPRIISENTLTETEELDELSKKTLGSYITKASKSNEDEAGHKARNLANGSTSFMSDDHRKMNSGLAKRRNGISSAVKKLTKESIDEGTHYHSVWVKSKENPDWVHHFDADNKEDANEEKRSCKNNGETCKVIRVPKDEADWRKPEHRAKAIARLNEETEELDELSKKTLHSYIAKAGSSAVDANTTRDKWSDEKDLIKNDTGFHKDALTDTEHPSHNYAKSKFSIATKKYNDADATIAKRVKGISKAVNKLVKESQTDDKEV